jgi:hypothetical protein
MVQFYFLTIFFLVVGSLVLLSTDYGQRIPLIIRLRDMVLRNQTNTIVMLVLTAVTGIMKLISPTDPGPAVLGDFVPAMMLLALSVFYGFELKGLGADVSLSDEDKEVDDDTILDSEIVDKAEGFYYKNKRLLGFIIASVAFLHFLFPGAVLL